MWHLIDPPSSIPNNERKIAALLRGFFRKETLRGGINAYERGQFADISNVDEGKHIIDAEVAEDHVFRVRLNVSYLPYSTCTCANSGGCRHMALLLLLLLEERGLEIDAFVRNNGLADHGIRPVARRETLLTKTAPAASASRGTGRNPAGGAVQDFRQWPERMRRLLPTNNIYLNKRAAGLQNRIDRTLLTFPKSWPDRDLAAIWQIHALLHALEVIESNFFRSYANRELFFQLADRYVDLVVETCGKFLAKGVQLLEKYAEPLHAASALLREHAFRSAHSPVNWLTVFRTCWSSIFNLPAWRDKEMAVLVHMHSRSDPAPQIAQNLLAAAAHLIRIDRGDEAAMRFVDDKSDHGPEERRCELYFDYLEVCRQSGRWDSLLLWARWLLPGMRGMRQESIRYFFDRWREAAEATGATAEWMGAVVSLLPDSIGYYGPLLAEQGDFAQWMDVFLTFNLHPRDHDPAGYEMATAVSPEVLLPFYHRNAVIWIEEKNRQGYRNAVIHLKELKKLYVRLKRRREWEQFAERLAGHYARLRALREEMRKGGLFS